MCDRIVQMTVPKAVGLFVSPLHLTFKSYFLPASSLPPSKAGCFPVPPGPWGSYMWGRGTLALSPTGSSAGPGPGSHLPRPQPRTAGTTERVRGQSSDKMCKSSLLTQGPFQSHPTQIDSERLFKKIFFSFQDKFRHALSYQSYYEGMGTATNNICFKTCH